MLVRQAVAAIIPAAILLVWTARSRPLDLGYGSLAAVPVTFLLAVLVGFGSRWRPRAAPAANPWLGGWAVFLAGGAATAWYWYRVWSYTGWELGGIVVGMFNVIGFWWPGVLVALVAWVIEEALGPPGGTPRYWRRLGAGFAAGATGMGLYLVSSSFYYERVDRLSLEQAVSGLEQELPFQPAAVLASRAASRSLLVQPGDPSSAPASLPYRHEGRRLTIELDGGSGANYRPYLVLRRLERFFEATRQLINRKDVDQVTVVVRLGGGELSRFRAAEADRGRSVWDLATLDRSRLKDGGRLDRDDVDAMLEGVTPDNRAEFVSRFRYTVSDDELRVEFHPPGPPDSRTAELYGAAWSSANNMLSEVVRYFPEIAGFHIDLPRLTTVIRRAEVAPGRFRLQHRLVAPDKVVGLIVSRGGHGQRTLDPTRFNPSPPVAGFQLALVRESGPLSYHKQGVLYEGILLEPGILYVTDIDAKGTVTLVLGDLRGDRLGPVLAAPGAVVQVGDEAVQNLGWLNRNAFAP
jgi:hypothetical protein